MLDRSKARNGALEQAIKTTEAIALANGLSDVEDAINSFWRLYWGELARVRDPSVELAMVAFGRELQRWQQSGQKPNNMVQLSLEVTSACQNEIEASAKEIDAVRNRYSVF
jgi:hypothetical protein